MVPLNAANGRQVVVTDYGPDPRSPARDLAAEVGKRLHGFLVPAYAGGDVDPSGQYHGTQGPVLQSFVGLANPASTTVAYRNGGYADLSSAVAAGPTTDPVRRIFADRLRRRQP